MTSHPEIEEELSKAALLRELEEARIRECQMEKTVRWWTACTAGWRQKWSKVRQERDSFKRQSNTINSQLNCVLNELQHLLEGKINDETSALVTSKIENLLKTYRMKTKTSSPDPLYVEANKVQDDNEEIDSGTPSELPVTDQKIKHQNVSKVRRTISDDELCMPKDKEKSTEFQAPSKNKESKSSISTEQEKNDSLLEIMSEELENIASEKKRLHMDVENLKSKKIALKQELRVSQLELDTLKEQLQMMIDTRQKEGSVSPDLDKDRLLIENSTLRSQVRDLCYEICMAQEEIDKVSEQIIRLKEKNEEFLEHKETCMKEIERLNLRLQLCGFYEYKEPHNNE